MTAPVPGAAARDEATISGGQRGRIGNPGAAEAKRDSATSNTRGNTATPGRKVKPPKPSKAAGLVPKPQAEFEVGVPGYLPFAVPYKNAWEVLREDDITVKQLVAMRRTDGQARALFRLITHPIRSALKTATFVPENVVDGGEEEAEFCEQMFTLPKSAGGMAVPFSRVVAQMLLAIFDGFSAFELVYWSPPDGPLKGKWTLKKMAHRPAETLTFLVDENSEFKGIRQRTNFNGRYIDVTIPAEHCVYWAAQEEEKPFYGKSYFEPAFFHWDKKFRLYAIAHIAAQRAAVGTRIGKLPPNPNLSEKAAFQRALADLGVAQYMTIPDSYEVEALREGGAYNFLDMINHHNSQMSKSVLAAFFDKSDGESSAKLVDFGQQSDALFMMMLATIMGEIEDIINHVIVPRFIDWNFGTGKYPTFRFGPLTEETKDAVFDLFKTLAVGGQSLTIRPEFLHELEKQVAEEIGLEIDWETVEAEMAFEKEQAALQTEQEAQDQVDEANMPGGSGGPPEVDPALLPPGFTLLSRSPAANALTLFARELLDEAYSQSYVELVRGKPTSGGPKYVRTAEGAKVYGVPIGTPITRDLEQRTAKHGEEGKPFGGRIRDPNGSDTGRDTSGGDRGDTRAPRQRLGGGKGAKSHNPGVRDEGHEITPDRGLLGGEGGPDEGGSHGTPKRTFSHPDQPGVQLLDYGDGTVAIRDQKGRISARQRYDIAAFLKLGWKVDAAHAASLDDGEKKAGANKPGVPSKPAGAASGGASQPAAAGASGGAKTTPDKKTVPRV